MRTVSLEMAKKLKEAGLQHQIVYGDWYLAWLPTEETYLQKPVLYDYTAYGPYEEDIWLPTLSDLLEWLEGRGYVVDITQPLIFEKDSPYFICDIWEKSTISEYWEHVGTFEANSREDAAAKAVLWVLEQEGKDE